MSAEYLVSSLPPLPFDGPAPLSAEDFAARCAEWLSPRDAAAARAIALGGECAHPAVRRWRDIETQMRNAIAAERARARSADASKWRRPEEGCDLFWKSRAAAAFRETDPLKREAIVDRALWDAACELVAPSDPLGPGAAFAYAVRLSISIRRSKLDRAAGNAVFDRIAAAARAPAAAGKEKNAS